MKSWPYPFLFAHRGGGKLAPENTIAAMRCGLHHSYSAVELDVKLSADGIAMLMHDDSLERTTNGRGHFRDMPAQELEKLDAGSWFDEKFAHERIPRFSAAMAFLHTHGMNADIEIKPCPGREAETGAAVGALVRELTDGHSVKPLLSSFNIEALRAAHRAAPDYPLMLLLEEYVPAHEALLVELGCVAVCVDHTNLRAYMVKDLHRRGIRVLVYTVNDIERVTTLQAMGVDGVCTDNLAVMARAFPHALAAA